MDCGVGSRAESTGERISRQSWARPVLLIVDDEPLGLKAMASVFEGQGYDLEFAGSGDEAMRLIETGRPDVILLDVMMPGMDGLEACRRIRSHPGMAEVPILLVTALDDRKSRLQGLESGADDYITKPFDRAEVRARVRTITRLNRFRRLQEEIVYSRQTVRELREYSRRLDLLRKIDRAILLAGSADGDRGADPASVARLDSLFTRRHLPTRAAGTDTRSPGRGWCGSAAGEAWSTRSSWKTWAWHSRPAPRDSVL